MTNSNCQVTTSIVLRVVVAPFARYGNKQGTARTYLADAAENGAKFVHECKVDKIVHEATPDGRRKATGVLAWVGTAKHRVTIKARRCVVVAAGSLNTPCVLLRSGFEGEHIGKHLRLHPVTSAVAQYKGRNVSLWKGAPMTTVCSEAEMGPENDGYGAKLEIPSAHVGLVGASSAWHGGAQFKEMAMHSVPSVCLDSIWQRLSRI